MTILAFWNADDDCSFASDLFVASYDAVDEAMADTLKRSGSMPWGVSFYDTDTEEWSDFNKIRGPKWEIRR